LEANSPSYLTTSIEEMHQYQGLCSRLIFNQATSQVWSSLERTDAAAGEGSEFDFDS
jgi:hypothetical protein